ncbi:hypothetical protein AGABI2DRAFT_192085 [Agaricus bisporus var. bisporus H97]|uniref:hypothetical protein n=1 Tax=Agaricus bisporus var. bisporus (strain H97 / ATCC MYA-4626 / FGSC 10389) TaxID=936046 RepID=UPI00029F4F5F|nr:hypothetical protein AGABI2DRAFT_192085 [Agaricus bisporus var. bisporus H97]EKV48486.1 hypothetical protein AGABI2DRAFT_192085 [Agaricus bisporus var. bisporus H97]
MRKLLRRFSKWMSITTLAEDPEDCPICLEQLKKKKAYAIPCEHLICTECLPQISKGADETVMCPQCRRVFPREEVGLLQYTETERWDELLKLAGESTHINYGGGETTSEQEEEDFIDDDESRTVLSEGGVIQDQSEEDSENEGVHDESRADSTTPGGPVSYAESPTREKRKKMEELASTRSKRQRVL